MNKIAFLLSIIFSTSLVQADTVEDRVSVLHYMLFSKLKNQIEERCLYNDDTDKVSKIFNVDKELFCSCMSEKAVNSLSQDEFFRKGLDPNISNDEFEYIMTKYRNNDILSKKGEEMGYQAGLHCVRILSSIK